MIAHDLLSFVSAADRANPGVFRAFYSDSNVQDYLPTPDHGADSFRQDKLVADYTRDESQESQEQAQASVHVSGRLFVRNRKRR